MFDPGAFGSTVISTIPSVKPLQVGLAESVTFIKNSGGLLRCTVSENSIHPFASVISQIHDPGESTLPVGLVVMFGTFDDTFVQSNS